MVLLAGSGGAASAEEVSLHTIAAEPTESSVINKPRTLGPALDVAPMAYLHHTCAVRQIYSGVTSAEEPETTTPEAATLFNAFTALHRFTGLTP